MRSGLKVLLAVAIAAGAAACDTGDDDVELYEGEEAATPGIEPAETEAAILTAQFEPTDEAQEQNISGTVRIFPLRDGLGTTDATGTTGTTDRPATTGQTDADEPTANVDATATGQDEGFRIELTLTGLTQGEHAWHIHSAPCGEAGPIEVAFSETRDEEGLEDDLEVDDTGQIQQEAEVPADELTLQDLQSGQYSLNVHQRGGEDHGPAIACADLSGQNNTTGM